MDEFLEFLADALEAEEALTDLTVLADLEEWDSLGTLAVVVEISDKYSVSVTSEELATVSTVADLLSLVESKG